MVRSGWTGKKILLVHQNFPGQFRGLAPHLLAAGHDVRALSVRRATQLVGVPHWQYRPRRGSTPQIHPWVVNTESAVIRGEAVAEAVDTMRSQGWMPDLVLGHTGWGEMLFMRQAAPQARLLGFNELFYQDKGGDTDFDPEFPPVPGMARRLQASNMHLLSSLLACDEAITPTQWQASRFPDLLRERLHVIHDGIDTTLLQPSTQAEVRLGRDGRVLRAGDEVVTFVNRNLEPMRGYHQFMRALPEIQACRPKARVVIVGGDGVSYGVAPPGQKGFKEIYLEEVHDRLDMSRVHFVDQVPYALLMDLLRVSAVHVYLTVPFVLSWSMLEAMSVGALVVGSDTGPVREVIEHGRNGLLVDFFSPAQLADTVCGVLAQPGRYAGLRAAARQTVVEHYDFQTCSLPRYMRLMEAV